MPSLFPQGAQRPPLGIFLFGTPVLAKQRKPARPTGFTPQPGMRCSSPCAARAPAPPTAARLARRPPPPFARHDNEKASGGYPTKPRSEATSLVFERESRDGYDASVARPKGVGAWGRANAPTAAHHAVHPLGGQVLEPQSPGGSSSPWRGALEELRKTTASRHRLARPHRDAARKSVTCGAAA